MYDFDLACHTLTKLPTVLDGMDFIPVNLKTARKFTIIVNKYSELRNSMVLN